MAYLSLASWQNIWAKSMISNEKKRSTVALIFTTPAQRQIQALAVTMPLWVIESAENSLAVADARLQSSLPLTVFLRREGESKADMCARVMFDVDDHHQFDSLELYGILPSDIDPEVLAVLGIASVQQTEYGCRLTRKEDQGLV